MNITFKYYYKACVAFAITATSPFLVAKTPDISLILDGQYTSYDENPENYELPGFQLAGEASEMPEEGFTLGHAELAISSAIDDKFYGKLTVALAEHDGATEVEIEEAYIETTNLGHGLTVRAGRMLSAVGYNNQQHKHAWDFADAPLISRGLWGDTYIDDGLRVSWIAPTDVFFEAGIEAFAGRAFPAGEKSSGIGAKNLFVNVGGDISTSSSWQLGLSHYMTDVENRSALSSHGHDDEEHDEEEHEGEEHEAEEAVAFSGDSKTTGLSAIYKWAPNGNYKNKHVKLQAEYYYRKEDGTIAHGENNDAVKGNQKGGYIQGVYQFAPQWRAGLRFDRIDSDFSGEEEALDEAGLHNEGVTPKRYTASLEYVPSEFSRLRLQYNIDDSYDQNDNQVILQYTMSLGSHGAHSF